MGQVKNYTLKYFNTNADKRGTPDHKVDKKVARGGGHLTAPSTDRAGVGVVFGKEPHVHPPVPISISERCTQEYLPSCLISQQPST